MDPLLLALVVAIVILFLVIISKGSNRGPNVGKPYDYYNFCTGDYPFVTSSNVNLDMAPMISADPVRYYSPTMNNIVNLRIGNSLGEGSTVGIAPYFYVGGQVMSDPSYLAVAGSNNEDGTSHPTFINSGSVSGAARVGFQNQLYNIVYTVGGQTGSMLRRFPSNIDPTHQYIYVGATMVNGQPSISVVLRDTNNTLNPNNLVY